MSKLKSLAYDNDIEQDGDKLGGGFSALESGVYKMTVKLAYTSESKNGALGLHLTFETEHGQEYRETLWMTNREGKNFYVKDGEKRYLPGFTTADHIALLTTQKSISQLDTEELTVKLYNYEAGTEIPTKVDALKEMMGKEVKLGILKTRENKTKYNESKGIYEPTDEIREVNSINKVFHPVSNRTVPECRAEQEEAEFINAWLTKFEGQTIDKTVDVKKSGKSGSPKSASTPRQSLFG